MSLNMLIYISRSTRPLSETEVQTIAKISAENNRQREITGLLLQIGNYFVQVLEGEERAIQSLLQKIGKDPRHTDLRTIYQQPVVTCLFGQWNMGYVNLEQHYEVGRLDLFAMKRSVEQAFQQGKTHAQAVVQVIQSLPSLLETCASHSE